MRPKPELRALATRLRVEDRLSIGEIAQQTGASRGSLSLWLKPYPLTAEERKRKHATANRYVTPKKSRGVASRLYEMSRASELTREQKAKIAEAAVLLRLVVHGLKPFGAVFDGDKADWLVEGANGKTIKLQVKWASESKGHGLPVVSLECRAGKTRRRYAPGEFDFLVGYDLYMDACFVWAFEELHQRRNVTVCTEAAERWDKLLAKI